MGTSREHLRWLAGATIQRIEFRAPLEWMFAPSVGGIVRAFASWRVVTNGAVIVSSNELHYSRDLQPAGGFAIYEIPALTGRTVASAEVRDVPRDLVLSFESGGQLELLSLYSEGESWGVTSPDGFHLLGYPRGEIATWNG